MIQTQHVGRGFWVFFSFFSCGCCCYQHFLSCQTLVEETVSREIYEDTHSLLREMLREMSSGVDIGFSFKFSPTEGSMSNSSLNVHAGVNFEKKTMLKQISEFSKIKVKLCNKSRAPAWGGGDSTQTLRRPYLTTRLLCTLRTRALCE